MSDPAFPPFYVGTDPDELTTARDWLAEQLADTWLTPEDIDELRLAITETLTNLLQHAGPRAKSELTVAVNDTAARVLIKDDSPPFEPGAPTDTDREGGFGLMLLHMLTDEVEISEGPTGGSLTRLTKLRPAD